MRAWEDTEKGCLLSTEDSSKMKKGRKRWKKAMWCGTLIYKRVCTSPEETTLKYFPQVSVQNERDEFIPSSLAAGLHPLIPFHALIKGSWSCQGRTKLHRLISMDEAPARHLNRCVFMCASFCLTLRHLLCSFVEGLWQKFNPNSGGPAFTFTDLHCNNQVSGSL